MKLKYLLFAFVLFLSGCGQSALDACNDSKSHLWNPSATDNQYKGNELYWNAIKKCENQHG